MVPAAGFLHAALCLPEPVTVVVLLDGAAGLLARRAFKMNILIVAGGLWVGFRRPGPQS